MTARSFPRILLVLAALLAGGAAHAQVSCALDASTDVNVDFGSWFTNDPHNATSPTGFIFNCSNSGPSARSVKVCVGLWHGTGGSNPGGNFRRMVPNDGSNDYIDYNLYLTAARAEGTEVTYMGGRPMEGSGTVPGNASAQIMTGPLYGRTPVQSSAAKPYSSTFSGANVAILWEDYDPGEPEPECTSMTTQMDFPGSFTVSMDVPATCDFNTSGAIDFGTHSSLSGNIDGNINGVAAYPFVCGRGIQLTVSVGDGLHAVDQQRYLQRGSTSDRIGYEIYQNSGRTRRFGSAGNQQFKVRANGRTQSIRFYGRVAGGQPIPWVGTYTDTVVVTIEY